MKKQFPTLYGKSSNGKIKVWKIWAETIAKGQAQIVTEHGYEDSEQLQRAVVTVSEGKNIGRANATTPYEQALSEAESKWNKKQDKKYATSKTALSKQKNILPMLAHDYKKRGKAIKWPAFTQPKLNGIRCLAHKVDESTIKYLSRGGKEFTTLEHITPHLLTIMSVGEILDGELFTRDLTFQEITSAVKRLQLSTPKVEYWIYDVVQDKPFDDRVEYLKGLLEEQESPLIAVPTRKVKTEDQMKKLHLQFMKAEYEGTIIRNTIGTYRCDYRSADLQKYKDFIDEEFEIIGGKQGVGKDEGAVTFICRTEEDKTFDCRPRGTYEQRQEWWNNLSKLLGKKLTVRYQTRSDDNIPIFPVGIAIRDYE